MIKLFIQRGDNHVITNLLTKNYMYTLTFRGLGCKKHMSFTRFPMPYCVSLSTRIRNLRKRITRFLHICTPWTVYFIQWGRDCDGIESTARHSFPNGWTAENYIEESYLWADGPESWERVSKADYRQFEAQWRDVYQEQADFQYDQEI